MFICESLKLPDSDSYDLVSIFFRAKQRISGKDMLYSASTARIVATAKGEVNEIRTAEQLHNSRDKLDGYHMLMNDIDLSSRNDGLWVPIGGNDEDAFTGIFDGQGFTVSNLYITRNGYKYNGLFGVVAKTALVMDVSLLNTRIVISHPSGTERVARYGGGICGHNSGTIEKCYNSGGLISSPVAGGITGANGGGGTIVDSINKGQIIATPAADDWLYAGGISGINTSSIAFCYNTAQVWASSMNDFAVAGGISGANSGQITDSYNTGSISASSSAYDAYSNYMYGVGPLLGNSGVPMVYSLSNSGRFANAGGICGYNYKQITNTYNTGNVEAVSPNYNSAYAGGISAYNTSSAIVGGSVYIGGNIDARGVSPHNNNIGYRAQSGSYPNNITPNQKEAGSISTYSEIGWNIDFVYYDPFRSIWKMDEAHSYPLLDLVFDPILSPVYTDIANLVRDDKFLASAFSNEYLSSSWLQTQVAMGNVVYGGSYNFADSYKLALLDFIDILNSQSSIESDRQMGEALAADTASKAQKVIDIVGLFNEYGLAAHGEDIINSLERSAGALLQNVIGTRIAVETLAVDELDHLANSTFEVAEEVIEQVKSFLETQGVELEQFEALLKDLKSDSIFTKISNGVDYVNVGLIIIDTGIDFAKAMRLHGALVAENDQYTNNKLLVQAIIDNSKNTDLINAASTILKALEDENAARRSQRRSEIAALFEGLVDLGIWNGLKILPSPVAIIRTSVNLLTNAGAVNEKALDVIAIGDAAVCVSWALRKELQSSASIDVLSIDSQVFNYLTILGQLRIVGENHFYDMSNLRTGLVQFFARDQNEINEICMQNISDVFGFSQKYGLTVIKDYGGASLH